MGGKFSGGILVGGRFGVPREKGRKKEREGRNGETEGGRDGEKESEEREKGEKAKKRKRFFLRCLSLTHSLGDVAHGQDDLVVDHIGRFVVVDDVSGFQHDQR
jgi:hypothetical protein